jgi:SAM-dependent methyltransferase
MIERGRKEHPHLNLQVRGHPYLEFPDEAFDAIILFSVLTCIPTDEGQRRIMAEVSRLLCPGGVLYISDLPLQVDERNRGRYQKFAEKFGFYGVFELPDGAICRHHEMSWIGSLTSGLEAIETTEVEVITMNGHSARAFQYLGRKRDPGTASSHAAGTKRESYWSWKMLRLTPPPPSFWEWGG